MVTGASFFPMMRFPAMLTLAAAEPGWIGWGRPCEPVCDCARAGGDSSLGPWLPMIVRHRTTMQSLQLINLIRSPLSPTAFIIIAFHYQVSPVDQGVSRRHSAFHVRRGGVSCGWRAPGRWDWLYKPGLLLQVWDTAGGREAAFDFVLKLRSSGEDPGNLHAGAVD